MKHFALLLIFVLLCFIFSSSYSQEKKLANLIYEKFDGSSSLPAGWSAVPDSIAGYYTWAITGPYNPATPSAPSSPNVATFQSYNLPSGSTARLITPTLDWSSTFTPQCKFQFRRDTQYSSTLDSLYVDVSTDGGSSWIVLAGFRRSVVPPPFGAYFEEKTVSVTAYGGYPSLTFAFRGVGKWGNWIHIDNVFIGEEIVNDVGVTAISSPPAGNVLLTPQTIAVTINNFGTANQSAGAFNVRAKIWRSTEYPGGTPVYNNVESGPAVNSGSSVPFTFSTQWTPTQYIEYVIQVQTELSGDEIPSNDASPLRSVTVVPTVDISVTNIVYPTLTGLYTGTLGYGVKASVKNNGVDPVLGTNYTAEAWIGPTDGFPGSATFHEFAAFYPDIPAGATRDVTINATWVPTVPGSHTVRFKVTMAGDEVSANDSRDELRNVNSPFAGGPDAGGYYYSNSLNPNTPKPSFNWVNITSVGTPLNLTDDGTSLPITIPEFQFYDITYTQLRVNANGFITFDLAWGGSNSASNRSIPNADYLPDAIIAPFWDDLNPAEAGAGNIYYYNDAVNGRFIVQYHNIPLLGSTDLNDFEVILNYGDNLYRANTILFQYNTMPANESASTIGIENSDGKRGSQYLYDGTPAVRLDANFPDNFAIIFGKDITIPPLTPTFTVNSGWNMVSLPVTRPDRRKTILFPSATSNAFLYQAGYQAKDTIENGFGYWLKFPASDVFQLSGTLIATDSVDVSQGWNMIGSISNPVKTANITTNPPGLISSSYYGYNNGYYPADTIKPGNGYWIKIRSNGKLFLSSGIILSKNEASAIQNIDNLNRLIFTDNAGKKQILYFGAGVGDDNLFRYELPPLPPQDGFDVRFQTKSGGSSVVLYNAGEADIKDYTIAIQSHAYPIKIEWDIKETNCDRFVVREPVGGKVISNNTRSGKGQIQIQDEKIKELQLGIQNFSQTEIPDEFALHQNYPNPFNPTTLIKYDIPVSSWVNLKVFDVLGQEVITLVNEEKEAGKHTALFNSQNLSNGVYFYSLKTGQYNSVKKMLLNK
ncbi:MAG: choice-of-anchor J domain-containing protein [Bacteroidota bacterium]|nr:choice-of-anchor J domain-containing protein [Bacteroidota bacterium]